MSVYVDDLQIPYGRMKMCHMMADVEDELHAMADKIGVSRRWHQYPGTPKSHYDICMSKRAKAIALGATPVDARELVSLVRRKREQSAAPEGKEA